MKTGKLLELIMQKSIHIPLYLYQIKEKLKLDLEELFFLMYLVEQGENIKFDPERIKRDLNTNIDTIMKWMSGLSENGLINLEVIKNESGMMEESIALDGFYHKVLNQSLEQMNEEEPSSTTIFDTIQKEFGRMLTPMEYEIIGAWIDSNINQDLIHEALKEAVYSGVNNLRYIDKILYEWGKKGYKTKEDIEKSRAKRKEETSKKQEQTPKKEIFDYNWLEDEDE